MVLISSFDRHSTSVSFRTEQVTIWLLEQAVKINKLRAQKVLQVRNIFPSFFSLINSFTKIKNGFGLISNNFFLLVGLCPLLNKREKGLEQNSKVFYQSLTSSFVINLKRVLTTKKNAARISGVIWSAKSLGSKKDAPKRMTFVHTVLDRYIGFASSIESPHKL